MNRKCPNCQNESIAISGLILADVQCTACGKVIGVQWFFRAIFFAVILVVTALTGLFVLVDQGIYAALLMISLPIGAIGFLKARFSPLVVRRRQPDDNKFTRNTPPE